MRINAVITKRNNHESKKNKFKQWVKKQTESLHDILKYNIGVFDYQKIIDTEKLVEYPKYYYKFGN